MILQFNTGEEKSVDLRDSLLLWSKSPDSKFKELLDPIMFNSVKLNQELETLYWENGIDLCPDVLYSLSK